MKNNKAEYEELSFKEILFILKSNKLIIFISIFIAIFIATMYTYTKKPIYEASALIMIEDPSTSLNIFDMGLGAEKYYLEGLKIKPDHKGINEYLGELYIKTNRIDLAKQRLETLKTCNCEEYDELKELIDNN